MQLSIGSGTLAAIIALALFAGAGLATAWPTARQRAAYWTGYAVGRMRKLAAKPMFFGADLAKGPDITNVVQISPAADQRNVPTVTNLGVKRVGKPARPERYAPGTGPRILAEQGFSEETCDFFAKADEFIARARGAQ